MLVGCENGCRGAGVPTGSSEARSHSASPSPPLAPLPLPASGRIGHVFLIILENKGFSGTFKEGSRAPYLAKTLTAQGALLTRYYGIGHNSLGNYIAMISGQGPNPVTQQDCLTFEDFVGTGPDPTLDGQAVGRGCVYPATVPSLPDQLEHALPSPLGWKGYMEDMGKDPNREASTCGHPPVGAKDNTQSATPKDQYAARHDPFVYFHAIIDDQARCDAHVVGLDQLKTDLASVSTTPSFSVIIPNLCNDGHDTGCANGAPGGLASIDTFLQEWIPTILAAPGYRQDGLIVITFDEAETPYADSTACCGETKTPNTDLPGIIGMGGGITGAVLLSPFIAGGTVSTTPINHYGLLKTFGQIFGVPYLGYAARPDLGTLGPDVFTRAMPQLPARP